MEVSELIKAGGGFTVADLFNANLTFSVVVDLTMPSGASEKSLPVRVTYRSVTSDLEEQFSTGGEDGTSLPVTEQLALVVTQIEGYDGTPDAELFKQMHLKHRQEIMTAILRDVYPNV
jgi:antitoxin component of RelBE/YafQ-DinJ toxin-antitoxin module